MVYKQATNLIFTQRSCDYYILLLFLSNIQSFSTGRRKSDYGPQDYSNEIGSLIKAIQADSGIKNKKMLIAPSVASIAWTPEQVWDTGFIDSHISNLCALAVEQ